LIKKNKIKLRSSWWTKHSWLCERNANYAAKVWRQSLESKERVKKEKWL